MKALLLENIHPSAVARLEAAGFEVDLRKAAMSEDELVHALPGIDLLGIRSNTTITDRVLEAAPDLLAVGCFCIGTNQVDLAAAARRTVAVFNAPYSNTRSVVELVIGEIIVLARRLVEKTVRMHDGIWDKSAAGQPRDPRPHARHRRLRQHRLAALGRRRGRRPAGDLLRRHRPARARQRPPDAAPSRSCSPRPTWSRCTSTAAPATPASSAPSTSTLMKPRSLFINAARGMVVDTEALREHILSGHIAGAALDVFPIEPKAQGDPFESPLRGLDNVILTPHVGGSTQEAQEEIGHFVAGKLAPTSTRPAPPCRSTCRPSRPPDPPAASASRTCTTASPGCSPRSTGCSRTPRRNVLAQSLATRGEQGYVVTDIEAPLEQDTVDRLRSMPHTLRMRHLTP